METNKVSRTLRYHTKVRSGCLTCKKRKVKCDEAKPHYRCCTGSGRRCEGYRSDRTTPPISAISVPRRCFQYFQSQACKPLGGYFHSSFWGPEVLQTAVHYPSIRRFTPLTLQQCNLAIRQLASLDQAPLASEEGVTFCTLTASVLSIYLASIRGRFLEAFQHVRSSPKILQDFDRSTCHHPDATCHHAGRHLARSARQQWLATGSSARRSKVARTPWISWCRSFLSPEMARVK
ncbi:hypothetical protein MYCTH_2118798 [Thermothelomyces thermophilus ATCC 42464]|uniref:Zn(2)-C6 fungal-type domain-containing protein n=1 Tax=Thermothelomyces thermophilus (strain ATCC 42464 / BCRC 31852 / DSM 1799) TaxID=573729 RepID=G2QDZ4_THET4|nr:uncharacterized protein MYCTH_2118798 [Thermothelomyces thermophilus ATCC 42464]AEO58403.1 hypothetical protein MYCTH_2118798 [Thermothelomyces thermophilus ATCC 42464]